MKLPCQMIVWDVLPAIRAAIAEELLNCGLSQQEIAKELDMAPSAVSQYLSKKRGYRIVLEEDVKVSIRELAEDMKENRVDDLALRICEICKQLREEGHQCANDH
ncbi:winged helix-turn-helix transcriptional regulator [uncultured Methanolobus sp.]|uniref:transcriptional regulator n=1 Tax=uncultured Methanolobus sp. TaxID=218300 RepID=UPI002AABA38F|nr:winged helix-turn-helix transcriptional regulator [uncultured Methanolobus sp.]